NSQPSRMDSARVSALLAALQASTQINGPTPCTPASNRLIWTHSSGVTLSRLTVHWRCPRFLLTWVTRLPDIVVEKFAVDDRMTGEEVVATGINLPGVPR